MRRLKAVLRPVTLSLRADVAELVDAHGSGPCALRGVEVQVLSSASSGRRIGSPAVLGSRRFPCPRAGGPSRRAGVCGSPTSTRAAASGSTRSRACFRTSRSTTCRRPAGGRLSHLWFVRRIRIDVHEPFLDGPGGGARDVVQRPRRDRRGPALVAHRATEAGARRSTASGSTSIPTSDRPGSRASGSTATRRTAGGVDEARVARSSGRCAAVAVVAPRDRHRPARPSEQRGLLAGRRARARVESPRSGAAARGGARLPPADRRRGRGRARRGGRRCAGPRRPSCAPTASGLWPAWKLDSVAPGGVSSRPCRAAPCLRLTVRWWIPSGSRRDEMDMAGADLRLADDPSAGLRHGIATEHRVRELLVLVAELDPLRAAVQLRAREPDREVAPVVGRERARQVVRARSDGGAAGGDHGGPRLENPPVARRCSRARRTRSCRLRAPRAARRFRRTSASSPSTYETTTSSAGPGAVETSPVSQRASGSSSRPAATISGSISTRVSSSSDGHASRAAHAATPGPAPTSSSDRGRQSGRWSATCRKTAAAAAYVAGAR